MGELSMKRTTRMASPRVPFVHIFYISISHPPSSSFFVVCLLFLPLIFLGPTRISYVRPIKARGRADWTDLREGRGRLFQTFLWLTNVAMGFLVIGQKLPLVLKFSLELRSSSFNFPMKASIVERWPKMQQFYDSDCGTRWL